MILVLGHSARVHPTANSLLCAVCRYESGSAPNFPVARHPAKTLREPHSPRVAEHGVG